MKQLAKWLALGYILFAPWTTWLALTGWLRLPVVFLLASIVPALPYLLTDLVKRPAQIFSLREDWLLVLVSGLAWVAFFNGPMMGRSMNHAMSFTFAFMIYAIYGRWLFRRMGVSVTQIFATAMWAVIICDVIVVIEWITANFTGLVIRRWFVFDQSVTNMDFYYQLFFKSVAGVCEEPSLMAFNLNCLFPLGIYYLLQTGTRWQVNAYITLTLVAQVFIASSGGLGFLLIGYVWGNFATIDWRRVGGVLRNLAVAITVSLLVYVNLPFEQQRKAEDFVVHVGKKIMFSSASSSMRLEAWRWAINDWLSSPIIGTYPGYGNINHNHFGYQSGYLKILAETGAISLLLFVAWVVFTYVRISRVNKELRPYMVMAWVGGFGHLIIADGYYHISLWIPVAALHLIYLETAQQARGQRQQAQLL